MLTLEGIRWGEFGLREIFDIKPTANGIDKIKLIHGEGTYPYITRSDINNGVNIFVCEQPYSINSGNCISVGLDTQTAFYQPADFYTGQNIQILRSPNLNAYTAKFMLPLLRKTLSIFSWGGNGATLTRLKRSRIFLPVDESGRPDYAFMERFMRGIEQRLIREYVEQVSVRLRNTPPQKLLSLDGVTWGKFAIGDLFTVEIGKNIDGNKVDKHAGKIPYITRKESNNGLDGFIDNDTTLLNTSYPVITIGNETAEPFVQDFQFYTGTKVNILKPNTPLTRQALKFVAVSIKQHKDKYSYAFTINSARLKRQVIQLPITPSGIPDWHLMHSYVLSIESQRLSSVINHFTAKLNTGV